jgi:hypothetical protein
MSGQLHASTILSPGIQPPALTEWAEWMVDLEGDKEISIRNKLHKNSVFTCWYKVRSNIE